MKRFFAQTGELISRSILRFFGSIAPASQRKIQSQRPLIEQLEVRQLMSFAVPTGYVKLGTVTLDASNGTPVAFSGVTFDPSATYYFEASGTFTVNQPTGRQGDALYRQEGSKKTWTAVGNGGLFAVDGVTGTYNP